MRSRLVFCIMAGKSGLNSSYAITRKLISEGVRVIYLGPSAAERHVLAHGLEYRAFESDADSPAPPPGGMAGFRANVRRGILFMQKLHGIFERWCDEFNPDLVLLDANMLLYAPPFLKRKIPIININISLASSFQATVPPVFSKHLPTFPLTFMGRTANALLWANILAFHFGRTCLLDALVRFSFGLSREYKPVLRSIRRSGGQIEWTEYGPRLKGEVLVLSPREFDFPGRVLARHQHYIGAGVELERRDGDFDWSRLMPDRKLIYCSLGTCSLAYPHRNHFYECLFKTLSSSSEYQLILSINEKASYDRFASGAPNIVVAQGVPQLEVLKRAKIFLSQGGFNSVKEGLCFGVPIILFPGWHDQFGNAARILYHRLGLRGTMSEIDPPRLNQMLREVSNGSVTAGLPEMQRSFLRTNDCRQGIKLILNRMENRCGGLPSGNF